MRLLSSKQKTSMDPVPWALGTVELSEFLRVPVKDLS